MSRAYRIRVSESLRKVIRAEDSVSTQLELLDVMPAEVMQQILAEQLEKEGFERDGDKMLKDEDGVVIEVDLPTGTVTVRTESDEKVDLETTREGVVYDDVGPSKEVGRDNLRKEAQQELEEAAENKQQELQKQVTDRLERKLGEVRKTLDRATNKTVAEALKQKAAQMGDIKQIDENDETGDMTIVVEV